MSSALRVGINAAPLVAPRTGVGRYILGLLAGLRSIAPNGGEGDSEGAPFEVRPLFAPAAALSAEGPAAVKESRLRGLLKALPLAYEARERLRALALSREHGLHVLHETNHAAPRTRLPVVLTVHDLCTLLYPETQEPARARFFAKALRERAREASQVITPTAAIARQVVELLGVEAGRVRAIHHGIDGAPISPLQGTDQSLRASSLLRGLGVDGTYLLFVGALEPRKGLPVLLDAYDQLPAALAEALPLVLAGPAQRVDRALARRLEARRAGRVVQAGFVKPEGLPGLYRGAAALCLPSIYEGFGLPLAEALASGTPCVISDDPSLVEVAGGAALVAPRGDAAAFAGHLAALAQDPVQCERLSLLGVERARSFTWEASARAHLAAYRAAAEGA